MNPFTSRLLHGVALLFAECYLLFSSSIPLFHLKSFVSCIITRECCELMTNHYGFHEISGLRRKKGYNDKTKVSEVRDPMSQSILIVDDEVQVLEILSSFLEREGF